MKINRRTCLKIALAMLIAVLVGAGLGAPVDRVYAGGNATVTLAHVDGLPDGTSFTLNLYKVGDWSRNDKDEPVLKLNDELAAAAKVEPYVVYSEEGDAAKLLVSSNAVGNYIKAHASQYKAVGTQTVTAGAETGATFSGLTDNGLYLVTGETTVVGKKRWTPKSVYIDVLNGDKAMTLNMMKMESEPIVDDYAVIKTWSSEDQYKAKEAAARPKEVKIEITYGSTHVDTVTLNDANNWSYSWRSDESEPGTVIYSNDTHGTDGAGVISETLNDNNNWSQTFAMSSDQAWHVTEIADGMNVRYQAIVTDPSESLPGTFQIENKFDVTELEITKELDGYVDGGAESNITAAFRITGKIGDEVAYSNVAGITFAKGESLSKTITIVNIPSGLDSIEIEEVYSSGYTPKEKTITKAAPDADGVWRFKFENTHGPGQGQGVVNKYVDGKISEQQGL